MDDTINIIRSNLIKGSYRWTDTINLSNLIDKFTVFSLIQYYLRSLWLTTRPWATRLIDKCQVVTPIRQYLLYILILISGWKLDWGNGVNADNQWDGKDLLRQLPRLPGYPVRLYPQIRKSGFKTGWKTVHRQRFLVFGSVL